MGYDLEFIFSQDPSLTELLTYEEFCEREGAQPGESVTLEEAYKDYKEAKLGALPCKD